MGDVGLRGAPDAAIFARAQEEGWIVITRDLGFGNLLEYPLGTHAAIIVLPVPPTLTARQIRDTLHAFTAGVEPEMLKNALAVVEPGRYRIRRPEQSWQRMAGAHLEVRFSLLILQCHLQRLRLCGWCLTSETAAHVGRRVSIHQAAALQERDSWGLGTGWSNVGYQGVMHAVADQWEPTSEACEG